MTFGDHIPFWASVIFVRYDFGMISLWFRYVQTVNSYRIPDRNAVKPSIATGRNPWKELTVYPSTLKGLNNYHQHKTGFHLQSIPRLVIFITNTVRQTRSHSLAKCVCIHPERFRFCGVPFGSSHTHKYGLFHSLNL